MITEDYCSFEISKLLRNKGFNEPCRAYYDMGALKEDVTVPMDWSHSNFIDHISAPTLQLAMKWLREVHRIEIHIIMSELNSDNSRKYMFDIYSSDTNRDFDSI